MAASRDRVTVHSSWRGLAAAVASPLLLLAFSATLFSARGAGPVAIGALVLGVALGTVTVLDYPRRSEFSSEGVLRVCLLRRQLLPWEDVVAIERTGGSARDAVRRRDPDTPKVPRGGLVARGLGRRRFLLTDRVESRKEFDDLRALLDGLDVATSVRALRPSAEAPPTDLYRRRTSRDHEEPR